MQNKDSMKPSAQCPDAKNLKFLHQPDLEDPIVTCGHPKTDKIVEIGNGGSCRVTWISCGRASMAKSAKASADLTTFPVVLALL